MMKMNFASFDRYVLPNRRPPPQISRSLVSVVIMFPSLSTLYIQSIWRSHGTSSMDRAGFLSLLAIGISQRDPTKQIAVAAT